MKNFMYWDVVEAELIKILTDALPMEIASKIISGDFKNVPVPSDGEKFRSFFPAVLVSITDDIIAYDNAGLMPTTQAYCFKIYYLCIDNGRSGKTGIESRKAAKQICNVLMNNRTLSDLYIEKSETEVGMQGMGGEVNAVNFESEITELFYQMDVPVHVTSVDYQYWIKTFRVNT